MDASDAFAVNRSLFDAELTGLIESAASATSPRSLTIKMEATTAIKAENPASESEPEYVLSEAKSRKRSASQQEQPVSKKQKLELYSDWWPFERLYISQAEKDAVMSKPEADREEILAAIKNIKRQHHNSIQLVLANQAAKKDKCKAPAADQNDFSEVSEEEAQRAAAGTAEVHVPMTPVKPKCALTHAGLVPLESQHHLNNSFLPPPAEHTPKQAELEDRKRTVDAVPSLTTREDHPMSSPARPGEIKVRPPPTVKAEEPNQDGDQRNPHFHPERRALLERPDAEYPRKGFLGSDSPTTHTKPTPASATGANAVPAGLRSSPPVPSSPSTIGTTSTKHAWKAPRHAIHRQWDASKDDQDYETLLELRRTEQLDNIDRYVPEPGNRPPARRLTTDEGKRERMRQVTNQSHWVSVRHEGSAVGFDESKKIAAASFLEAASSRRPFPFEKLPPKAQDRIFSFLLTSNKPIAIDFTYLRPFLKGKARLPQPNHSIKHEGLTYTVPVSFDKVLKDVEIMQKDMAPFTDALERKAKHSDPPCHGLTTSLLRVSRGMHERAAKVFYGENTFYFSWPTTAWMQMESFLATIGPANVAALRHLRVHVPLWYQGIQADYIEGAILDLTSPASRFAVIQPPAHDRLLAAVQSVVEMLQGAGNLTSLMLDLEHGRLADLWTNYRAQDTTLLISASGAEEYVSRKEKGIQLLRYASEALAKKPVVTVYTLPIPGKAERKAAAERMPALVAEAEKYGWEVDGVLRAGGVMSRVWG